MSDSNPSNLLLQTMPDGGPGRTVMGMVAVSVAVSATTGTYLLGAGHHELGAAVSLGGVAVGILLFYALRLHVLGAESFSAFLPFELDDSSAAAAQKLIEELHCACKELIAEKGLDLKPRINVFRPSDAYQQYGCAYILRIDPRLHIEVTDAEVENLMFLPNRGITGQVYVAGSPRSGEPTVAITAEQGSYIPEELSFIRSYPLKVDGIVLGVLSIDFCCADLSIGSGEISTRRAEAAKCARLLISELDEVVLNRGVGGAEVGFGQRIADCFVATRLGPVRLLRGQQVKLLRSR